MSFFEVVLLLVVVVGVIMILSAAKQKKEGGEGGNRSARRKKMERTFKPIVDNFRSLEEVQLALRSAGLEASNLILGIDFTKSNSYTGHRTFGGQCLHALAPGQAMGGPPILHNPYQQVISILGRTLEAFDDDKLIPAFGFGDARTTNRSVFPLKEGGAPCVGFEEVLRAYNHITPNIVMSGPTSFAPLIKRAVEIVKREKSYHILVIIADGEVTNAQENREAIVAASAYPLSIIMVGVGDGPFDLMEEFDDELPDRDFDNFQFVNYNKIVAASTHPDVEFALRALMEVPDQYKYLRSQNML